MSQASGWQIYKRLFSYVQRHMSVFLIGVVATILFALVEVYIVSKFEFLINDVLEQVTPKSSQPDSAAVQDSTTVSKNSNEHSLESPLKDNQNSKNNSLKENQKTDSHNIFLLVGIGFIVLIAIRGLFSFLSTYALEWVGRKVVFYLRIEVFKQYLVMPLTFFDQQQSGDLISKITFNTETVSQASTFAIKTVLQSLATIIGALVAMYLISPYLTLVFLLAAPLIAVVVNVTSKRFRHISKNIQDSMGDVTQVSTEGVEGIKVIKSFGGHDYENQRMDSVANKNRLQQMKLTIVKALSSPVIQILASLGFAVVFYLAGQEFLAGNLDRGEFVNFFLFIMMLLKPLKSLSDVNSVLQRGIAGAQSIFEVLDSEQEKLSGTLKLERAKGQLNLEHVKFGYDDAKSTINNVSLSIAPGETVALVGPSGSGKSTLASLLMRFYDDFDGSIQLDGHDIQEIHLESLRDQFAYVSQQVVLFNDTIRNNIAYAGLTNKTDKEIAEAINNAYLDDVIESLDQGLDTHVGNAGSRLSGGQRQRIAIARALLKDAPILILDEATSALDNESEKEIQKALDNLMKGRTTIVIAHRLSTIESADKIVVLKAGEIVEQGSHSELIDKNGEYRKLYDMQFSG